MPTAVGVDVVSCTVFHSSLLQCSTNGEEACTRSKPPAGTLRTCRFIFHTSITGRGLSLRYRSATGSIRSKILLVHHRAQQFYILRVRPHQRNSRTGWRPRKYKNLSGMSGPSQICSGIRPMPVVKFSMATQVRINVASRRQFVGGAFAGQQRPRPSHAPAVEGAAIIALPVAIMVVALPARAFRSIHLQHGIHDLQRILDQRIAGLADAEAHQFQKARIHNFLRRILVAVAGPLVGQHQHAADRGLRRRDRPAELMAGLMRI